MGAAAQFSGEDFVWALGSLCRLHRVPFDPDLLRQQVPPPYDRAALLGAAQALEFRVGERSVGAADLASLPLPCVAWLRTEAGHEAGPEADPGAEAARAPAATPDEGAPLARAALIVEANDESLVYFQAGEREPRRIPLAGFDARFEPQVVLVAREAPEAPDDDLAPERRPFGFSWFVPELFKHKRIWRDVLVASLAIQVVALATPLGTQVVIDKVVVHHTLSTLWVVGLALGMFLVFNATMTWMRQYLVLHTGNRVDAVLGQSVFGHLFRLPMPYFEQRQTGVLVARLHGVEQIREFVSGAAVTLLLDCPFLFVFLGVMFWYSARLTLIVLAILLVIVVLSLAVTPIFRAKLNNQFRVGARNTAFVTEYVSGMATVKSLQMEPALERRYGELLAQYLAAGFETRQVANSYNVVANALEQAMTLAVLVAGAMLVIDSAAGAAVGAETFTIGMLVAFQMFAARLSQPLLRLVGLWQQFQQANVSVRRLGDIMDAPAEPYTLTPQRAGAARAGQIEFQSVSFRYSPRHPWLYRHLNLVIRPGQLTVLVGPSGCGKSTLAKLLQGFYAPSDGRILIDGQDARFLGANELRSGFGVVPQETTLFSGSVYDNLLMACPHADFDSVVEACRMAEIHDVIEQLPQGYQTRLGEHGVGLSGGQRQRIAIARALLKRPKVLIFDEATSNLDPPTAESFAQTVNQLKGKVTMLFIAHNLPRGLQVDEVVQFGPRAPAKAGQPGATGPQPPTQMSVIDEDKAGAEPRGRAPT